VQPPVATLTSRKHILFISSWYPTPNNPTHGIFNRYFAEAAALNNQVSVLHVGAGHSLAELHLEEAHEDKLYTVRVLYKKVTFAIPGISHYLKYRRQMKAYTAGFKKICATQGTPQLIHLNVVLFAGVGTLHLASAHNLPYVVNENWSGYCREDGNYRGFVMKYLTRKILAGAKAILPTSLFLQKAMQAHGLNGNYKIVPNVVNTQRFVPAIKTTGSVTRYLHISSLTEREKNVSGILRAFATASKQNTNLVLDIVGDGPDRAAHEALARQLGLEHRVVFKGRLTGQDLVSALQHCDCLVMFSHFETFCLVIAEAFACGKPVITSNAGAIDSYVTAELGIKVNTGDEPALAQALLQFPEKQARFDPAFIRDYALNNFSYEKVGQLLNSIYNDVLAG